MSTRSRKATKLHQVTKRVQQPAIVSSDCPTECSVHSEFGLLVILAVLILFSALV